MHGAVGVEASLTLRHRRSLKQISCFPYFKQQKEFIIFWNDFFANDKTGHMSREGRNAVFPINTIINLSMAKLCAHEWKHPKPLEVFSLHRRGTKGRCFTKGV